MNLCQIFTILLVLLSSLEIMHADIEVFADPKSEHNVRGRESSSYASGELLRDVDSNGGVFLRTNWQIQGYLMEHADAIEK